MMEDLTKPVEIKYRDGKWKDASVMADRCSGEIPAGSHTYYCVFYLDGKQVARVPENRLRDKEVYKKLLGRPWLQRLQALDKITLTEWDNWQYEFSMDDDTDYVYRINHEQDMFVFVAGCRETARAVLHVMNNEDVVVYNIDRYQAIKALFPDKKVTVMEPTVRAVEL